MFSLCKSLQEIKIPDSVIRIGSGAFYGCESLESIILPSGVYTINMNVFNSCINLKTIEALGVTGIDEDAFATCVSLERVSLSDDLDYIGDGAFYDCPNLHKLVIRDSQDLWIGDTAFEGCDSLTVYTDSDYVVNCCKEQHIEVLPLQEFKHESMKKHFQKLKLHIKEK